MFFFTPFPPDPSTFEGAVAVAVIGGLLLAPILGLVRGSTARSTFRREAAAPPGTRLGSENTTTSSRPSGGRNTRADGREPAEESREPGDDRGEPAQSRGQAEGSLEMKIDRDGAYELDLIPSTIRAGSELLPFLSLGRGAHPHCPCPRCAPRSAPSCRNHDPEALVGWRGRLILSRRSGVSSRVTLEDSQPLAPIGL
jgi:hypothetical protein